MGEKIDSFKKEYSKLEKKHGLPSFKDMNEEFDIEKLAEHETELLLREMRKLIVDKSLAYLRFVEMLLNPSNAPMFFFSLLKGLTAEDKKTLEETYHKLAKIELKVIAVDNDYSEASEAEFIKYVLSEWVSIKGGVRKISNSLETRWDVKSEKKDKSYLG